MKNFEKYKTAEERAKAFFKGRTKAWNLEDAFAWLDLEADKEKPLPCPFCGRQVIVRGEKGGREFDVTCSVCEYMSSTYGTKEESVAAHNRVARAVMAAKEKEAK